MINQHLQIQHGQVKSLIRAVRQRLNNPVKLMDFIEAIERALGKTIQKELLPLQAGDVPATYANVDDLVQDLNYKPATPVQVGIDNFVKWYREFFKV